MKTKKKILIYSICLLVLITIGVSYAYFSANISGAESGSTVSADSGSMSIVYDNGSGNITAANIAPDSAAFATKTFTVTGNDTTNKEMNYALSIIIDNNTFSDNAITYTLESTNTSSSGTPVTSITPAKSIAGTTTIPLGTGQFVNGTGKVHTYVLKLYFLENNTDQSVDMNKNISLHIGIEALEDLAAQPGTASDSIKALDGHYTGNGGVKTIAHAATGNQTYATTDYRYYGANPNNYVSFNDELWRIIGVFEVENESGTKEYRLKLIRNDSIGGYSWDTSASTINSGLGINEWSQADLMKLLNPGYETNTDLNSSGSSITVNNSLYWTKESGTCYNDSSNVTTTCNFTTTGLGTTAKSMIDKAKYYIGGWNSSSTTTTQFYTYERGSNVIASPTDGVTRTTTWTGYVGLPYVSDYGYATDESICLSTEKLYYSTSDGYYGHAYCHTNDWLTAYYWTITPYSSYSNYVWDVNFNGDVDGISAYFGRAVRPTLYLKSTIKIVNGTGTSTNPYVIGV
jgi:hypothetical protein